MIIPIPIFIPIFPYVKFKKRYSPNEYRRINVGDGQFGDDFKELLKKNKDLLFKNNINLNKIRFVFTPAFTYDIEKNVINPKYTVIIPLRTDGSGLYDKDAPLIELKKPKKLVYGTVKTYKIRDNYEFIREMIRDSRRGVVIYINKKTDYEFGVDTHQLRIKNLDEMEIEETVDSEQIPNVV